MPPLATIHAFRRPAVHVALASPGVGIDALAQRLGFAVEAWEEEGLGPARGVALRLPSGRPVLLQELQYAVQYHGGTGPDVLVDAADLGAVGVQPPANELCTALGPVPEALVRVHDAAAPAAARRAEWAAAFRTARQRGAPPPPYPAQDLEG